MDILSPCDHFSWAGERTEPFGRDVKLSWEHLAGVGEENDAKCGNGVRVRTPRPGTMPHEVQEGAMKVLVAYPSGLVMNQG